MGSRVPLTQMTLAGLWLFLLVLLLELGAPPPQIPLWGPHLSPEPGAPPPGRLGLVYV